MEVALEHVDACFFRNSCRRYLCVCKLQASFKIPKALVNWTSHVLGFHFLVHFELDDLRRDNEQGSKPKATVENRVLESAASDTQVLSVRSSDLGPATYFHRDAGFPKDFQSGWQLPNLVLLAPGRVVYTDDYLWVALAWLVGAKWTRGAKEAAAFLLFCRLRQGSATRSLTLHFGRHGPRCQRVHEPSPCRHLPHQELRR